MSPRPVAGICEDDDELRGALRDALQRDGFAVRATASGAEAVRGFSDVPPDVLVLDIGLPDADGRDVCQVLRDRGIRAPVLFLTARDALTDRLSGFDAGGDDYLAKPFVLAELLARIHALVRRGGRDGFARLPSGLHLDLGAHAARYGDREIALTPTEFRLLAALAEAPGAVVRRATLVAAGWPDGAVVNENTLDAYIARIRRKLRDAGAPEAIETVRGAGYRLQ
jgi:two-component system, OmpR family, response regulator